LAIIQINRTLNIYCISKDSLCCGLEYLITKEQTPNQNQQ